MKQLLLFVLMCFSLNIYSQNDKEMFTLMEKMFGKELNVKDKTIAESNGLRRELVPYAEQKGVTIKKYLLTEYDAKNIPKKSAYIVSKEGINKDYPLFKIALGTERIINVEKMDEDSKYKAKLAIKFDKEYTDVSLPISKLPFNIELNTEVCVDHWWVTYVEETGEILGVEYLGSDCYNFESQGGGSGTGSNPPINTNSCNLTCEQAAEALNSITGIPTPEDHSCQGGSQYIGGDGKIRKPKNPIQGLLSLLLLPGYEPHYSAYFKGVVYKDGKEDPNWKWESCVYNYTAQDGGSIPPCFELSKTINVGEPVIAPDRLSVSVTINFQFLATFTCLGVGVQYGNYSSGHTYIFYSSYDW